MRLIQALSLALQGGPGGIQLALTNACNAHCRFCSFSRTPPAARMMADFQGLCRGLGSLVQAGIRYVILTGGEPLLYPDLLPLLKRAQAAGLTTLLCTNGALLTPALVADLKQAGLDTLIISLDAPSPREHDDHRGLPGLTQHLRTLLPQITAVGLKPVASVTLSRLIPDLNAMARFVHRLGFRRLTFSYPLTNLYSSYLGYADHDSVTFTPQELDALFAQIITLKDKAPLAILNPKVSLLDLQRQLRRRPPRFPCLAGFKYFYVDWHLMVYPCHYQSQVLGAMTDLHRFSPQRNGCAACTIDCYRDPSVYQYCAVSVADTLKALSRGDWRRALCTLLHPYNFLSLASLWEARHWLQEG